MMKRKPRVFLGLLDIVGYYGSLWRGFREIGCEAHLLHLGEEQAGRWTPDALPAIPRWYFQARQKFASTRDRTGLGRWSATALYLVALWSLIIWIAVRMDIIILKSGESLISSKLDLKLWRLLSKKLVFFYHGSDSRPPYMAGGGAADLDPVDLARRTRATKRAVEDADRLADFILDHPLSSHFHTKPVYCGSYVGNLVDREKIDLRHSVEERRDGGVVRILHAPSVPRVKGTDIIRREIKRLKAKYDIEYVEIIGMPNSKVLEEIARCDFVIDELYSDAPGAAFALEAASFGKPAVVCGYGKSEQDRWIPIEWTFPSIFGLPEEMPALVERLIVDKEYRIQAGQRAKEFMQRSCYADQAAQRLLNVIEGTAPQDGYFDPADICYCAGFGGPAARIAGSIRRMVEACGESALQLDDKPALKQAVIDFAFASYDNETESS